MLIIVDRERTIHLRPALQVDQSICWHILELLSGTRITHRRTDR